MPYPLENRVGVFFVVHNQLLLHTCPLDAAEHRGELLVYPKNHAQVWRSNYQNRVQAAYNYYPRGRIVYHKEYKYYLLYCNQCSRLQAAELQKRFPENTCQLAYDESYRCHLCSPRRRKRGLNIISGPLLRLRAALRR